jgi:MFS family permease
MTATTVAPRAAAKTGWGVVGMLAAAQFIMVLDTTVMNVSISQVVEDLNTTIVGLQTAITMYTLVMASLMLIGGKPSGRSGLAFSSTGPDPSSRPSPPTCLSYSSAGRSSRASGQFWSSPPSRP